MFKYNLEQVVYCMLNMKVHSAPILSRSFVENLHEDWSATKEQRESFMTFGPNAIKYSTIHGVFAEADLFATKEDLTNSL